MAVNKSFVVKNGFEVNSNLFVADVSTQKVGIASTAPRSTLDVRGGIAATDINITGISTIANLQVADGDVDLTNLKVTGFSTLGGVTVDQLRVTGFTTFTDISYDEITGRNITITGIATIPTFDGLTSFTDGVEVTGISTYAEIDTTNVNVSGVATIDVGIIQNAQVANLNATGVTTIASLSVTGSNFESLVVGGGGANVSGVVTAHQFLGAGQIGIGTSGGLVGYGVSFLEFRGPGFTTAQFNSAVGIVTLSFQGGGGSGSASIGVGSTPGDAFTGIITAGNLWYNTGLGRLFIYYQDDNSAQWVDAAPFNVGIITQLTSVAFSTGTVAAPSLTFGTDTNTGFFAPADGSVSYSSNGAGIVTFNSTGVVATSYFGDGSNLSGIDATSLSDSGGNIKAQANPGGVVVTGVLTATSFSGDGSSLSNLPAGLGTALSSDTTSPLNKIYYTDQVLSIGSTITVDPPSTAVVAYTQYADVQVTGDADLIVGDGDEFVTDILGIGTTTVRSNLGGSGGRVLADNYLNASGTGAPTFPQGVNVTGVLTASSYSSISGTSASFSGNVTIGGTLTYTDVEHVDSVGIITAQQGIQVLANGLDVTGVSTFKSNVSIADSIIHTGDTDTAIRFPSADTFTVHTNGAERLRITSGGGIHFNNGELIERVNVTDGKLSDNTNIDLANGMVHLFTTAETTTATPNIRVDSSTALNSVMAIGDAISVTIVTTAAAAGYAATVNIDGATVGTNSGTLNWTGGSAPSDGGSSGVDIAAYTIMKTADAKYTVIATQTKTS